MSLSKSFYGDTNKNIYDHQSKCEWSWLIHALISGGWATGIQPGTKGVWGYKGYVSSYVLVGGCGEEGCLCVCLCERHFRTITKSHVPGLRGVRVLNQAPHPLFPHSSQEPQEAKLLQDSIWKGIFWPDGSTQKILFHPSKRAVALLSPLNKCGYTHTWEEHSP